MKKHLVFFHQNYPAQFGPVLQFLLQECDAEVTFFSEFVTKPILPGVNHHFYKRDPQGFQDFSSLYFFSRYFEQECRSMFGAYQALEAAKLKHSPDVFVGHVGFGNLMALHMAYPEIPTVGFFEIFYNPFDPDTYRRHQFPVPKANMLRMPLRNATHLIELEYCTRGYSPTPYQKSTFPKAYQDKLAVLFDGIDTHLYQPGEVTSKSELPRTWPSDARIVTYVARGLEAFRGFDIFMEVAHRVSQLRPDAHFVIAGNPQTHYGGETLHLKGMTFKDYVLKQHPFDLSRFHFLNWISEPALADLFRLSRCHFYWTLPFTLSWSFFQAMSTGALVMGSNSAPVRDVLADNENGLLAEPYDIDGMVSLMLDLLDRPEAYQSLRQAARETIVNRYSLEVCLPPLAEFYLSSSTALGPPLQEIPEGEPCSTREAGPDVPVQQRPI